MDDTDDGDIESFRAHSHGVRKESIVDDTEYFPSQAAAAGSVNKIQKQQMSTFKKLLLLLLGLLVIAIALGLGFGLGLGL